MTSYNCTELLEVLRGPIVESVHYGSIAVVDIHGRLVASCGNPELLTYPRSSAKPFQALPLVEQGGADLYQLTEPEIAILCASQSGTEEQLDVIRSIQKKVGLDESLYQCGTQLPEHKQTRLAMLQSGERPTPSRHECSGKHSGMLALSRMNGWALENYLANDHPAQKVILQAFAVMCSLNVADIPLGIDGCSAPIFGAPLVNTALGYARLADPRELPDSRAAACSRIYHSMWKHPDMVAGPERFDTAFMAAGRGKWISKVGAEGFLAIGIGPGILGDASPGIGIAIKIADGDRKFTDGHTETRARPAVALEVLRQLGALDAREAAELAHFASPVITNWRQIEVGNLRPVFQLERKSA